MKAAATTPLAPRITWLASLRLRPLLWIAPAIAIGCALGAHFASAADAVTRDASILLIPLVPAAGFYFLAWRWRLARPDCARISLCFALVCTFTTSAARRVLPPGGDISTLVRDPTAPSGPQRRVAVTLRGWVADHPRRGDFKVEFPLQCDEVLNSHRQLTGRVWIEAPRAARVQVGDAVALRVELADLPRAGNPGERSSQMRFVAAGCWCVARVKDVAGVRVLPTPPRYAPARWIARLRGRLLARYEAAFAGAGSTAQHGNAPQSTAPARPYPHATAQLLAAMVFGEGGLREPLPRLVRDQFRAAGLSHVLVASGTQVSFFALLLIVTARALGLRRWWLIIFVLPVLLLYALVTGGAASIWRATIAGLCLAWALLLGRDVDGLSFWSLALALLLLIDPTDLFSISLQLTFAATWGLLVLAPALRRLSGMRLNASPAINLLTLSLGAQLATLPLLLYHFGRVSVGGLGANLLAVPLAGFLVGPGVLGLLFPSISIITYPLTRGIAGIAAIMAQTPGGEAEALPLRLPWTLLCYALLIALTALPLHGFTNGASIIRSELARWRQRRQQRGAAFRWRSWLVAAVLCVTAIAVWQTVAAGQRQLIVTILDVGQGESIVIRAPSGRTVLIDGGSISTERADVGRSVIVPYLQSCGVRRIDALVLTHADSDHCNALPSVLREVPVALALDGAAVSALDRDAVEKSATEVDYQEFKTALQARGVPIFRARGGQRLHLGEGVEMTVLAPLEPPLASDNDNATVLRLDYGETSVLLTADIEQAAEERLVRRGANLRCTVLKVAHHGSKTSTSPAFLKAAQPQAAVLSCGRYNSFGHPAPQTLGRLAQRRAPVFRTDVNGAVEISCDGRECWIQTYR